MLLCLVCLCILVLCNILSVEHLNPQHTKPYSKTSEDEYNYVQPNEYMQHSNFDDTIKMDTNPSYGVSIEGDRATTFSVTATNSNTKADKTI